MIHLARVRSKAAISSGLRGKLRVRKLLQLLERRLLFLEGRIAAKELFNSTYWKNAKPQMIVESHGKCAYCEAPTTVVAHGDVEHFRPKAVYWWLAYCYDNYLYSCQICNEVYKSDFFPTSGMQLALNPPLPDPFPAHMPAAAREALVAQFCPDPLVDTDGLPMASFVAACNTELASLVDAYLEDPELYFKYIANDTLKTVDVAPRDANNPLHVKRCEASVQYLGLNREELQGWRWTEYRKLAVFRKVIESPHTAPDVLDETKAVVTMMMADDAPYAGMVRYFARDEWNLNLD